LLIDGGDLFGNLNSVHSLDDMLKGEYLLQGMEMCAYDAMTLGERDFRFGETFLTAQTGTTDIAVTSANTFLHSDGTPYATRFFTKDLGELTVGVVGMMSAEFKAEVAQVSSADGEQVDVGDPVTELYAALGEMGPVDLVVLLAHMPLTEAHLLAAELSGVDVMLISHEPMPPVPVSQIGDVWVAPVGYDGKWIGHLNLEVANGSVVSVDQQGGKLNDSVPDDPDLAAHYQNYLDELETKIEEIIDSIPEEVPPGGAYVGADVCATCHASHTTRWSTTAHSQAFDTLVVTNHDYAPSCFPCHATGFGYLGGFKLPELTPTMSDVQCESCHGAGADHAAAPAPGWSADPTTACANCHTAEMSPDFNMVTYLPQVTCNVPYGPAQDPGDGASSKKLPLP
jgi:2',3'-cyclic-nucleotide 2'-phosphodiesterase (5'-nucleotidase family)